MNPRLKGKLKTSQYSGTVKVLKTRKLILNNTLESKFRGNNNPVWALFSYIKSLFCGLVR